jgi:hypothetical protein
MAIVDAAMSERFNRICAIKPDHLGDLVLALPNMRFLESRTKVLDLFVQTRLLSVACDLMPGVNVFPIDLNHLTHSSERARQFNENVLAGCDAVFVFRHDEVMTSEWCKRLFDPVFDVGNRDECLHETIGQAERLRKIFGVYDLQSYMYLQAFGGLPACHQTSRSLPRRRSYGKSLAVVKLVGALSNVDHAGH